MYYRKEATIFECVNTALKECANSPDEATARGMLQETTTTVRDMCEMREISGKEVYLTSSNYTDGQKK